MDRRYLLTYLLWRVDCRRWTRWLRSGLRSTSRWCRTSRRARTSSRSATMSPSSWTTTSSWRRACRSVRTRNRSRNASPSGRASYILRRYRTGVRLSKVITVRHGDVTRAADPLAAVTPSYIFIYDSLQEPTHTPHTISINQSITQSVSQSVKQPTNQPTDRPINQSINQSISHSFIHSAVGAPSWTRWGSSQRSPDSLACGGRGFLPKPTL